MPTLYRNKETTPCVYTRHVSRTVNNNDLCLLVIFFSVNEELSRQFYMKLFSHGQLVVNQDNRYLARLEERIERPSSSSFVAQCDQLNSISKMAGGLEPSKGAVSHDAITSDKQSPDRNGGGGIGPGGSKQRSMQVDMMDKSFVRLRQEIGLFNGITIIVGCIIGSGIFLSPKSVLENAGSVGMSMVVWVVSGVFSLIGALCFAELGTTILASGGEYSYILFAFGELPAFILLWATLIIINPTGQAIIALTFANYVMQPFVGDCENPSAGVVQIVAILCLALLTFVNCWSVPWATKVQDVFTIAKVLALLVIILSGLVYICMGNTENFQEPFKNSKGGSDIALAFYGGLFAYAAWNYLNYLTEEIKNPYRNLPWAIGISLPLVTVIYVLANIAYFAVLTPEELENSNAVAVTFGEKLFGPMAWIMPVSVAMSTFGGVNGGCLSLSRLFFVGAREGQLPAVMSMIQVKRKTPLPSLIFTCVLSIMYVFVEKIETLLNYFSFMTWLAIGAAVAGQLYLRWAKPDLPRPIKLNIMLPIIFVAACLFLVVMGTIAAPMDTLIGILITLTGFPVYFAGVWWKKKPKCLVQFSHTITVFMQKVFVIVPQEKEE